MTEAQRTNLAQGAGTDGGRPLRGTLVRLIRYIVVKGLTLFATVAVGICVTLLIVNLGGYVDEIFKSQIAEQVGLMIYGGWPEGAVEPERTQIIEQTIWAMEEAQGLHQPFLERSG